MDAKEFMEREITLLEENQDLLKRQNDFLEYLVKIAGFWFWLTIIGLVVPVLGVVLGLLFKFSVFTWLISRLMYGG